MPLRRPFRGDTPRRGRRAASALVLLTLVVVALLGCTSKETPARSPFDDRGGAPTAPPGTTSFPPPFAPPLLTPTPGGSGGTSSPVPTSPEAGDRESAIGAAIEALAQRMAVSATRISLVSAERVDWPNGCLGADLLGLACMQVITPGYRVLLRYDTGSTHEMRTGRGGASAWVAQLRIEATVQQPERASSALALTDASGKAISVLLAPGTQRLDAPVGSLKAGDRVILAADDVNDGSPLRAVWIAKR